MSQDQLQIPKLLEEETHQQCCIPELKMMTPKIIDQLVSNDSALSAYQQLSNIKAHRTIHILSTTQQWKLLTTSL